MYYTHIYVIACLQTNHSILPSRFPKSQLHFIKVQSGSLIMNIQGPKNVS